MTKKFAPETFLENGFPVTKLHSIALGEGNSKRPVYQIHKWWARRLGSVFRTLLISSTLKPKDTNRSLWAKYYNGFSMDDKVILDPMMGGGTSIVEALRLGCKVIGYDINPVAWFVTKKEIERFNEKEIEECYQKIKQDTETQIQKYYETICNKKHKCQSIYTIWSRTIKCESCTLESDLVSSTIIRDDGEKRVYHCPMCNGIFNTKQRGSKIKCNLCKSTFSSEYRTIRYGYFSCPHCNNKQQITEHIKKLGKPLPARIICIEFECDKCGRGFKKPTKKDFKIFESTKRKLTRDWKNLLFPRQKVSDGHFSDTRPKNHGFEYYYQLFNPRQLLCLSLLLKEIMKIKDKNTREYLLLTFSSCLETNNALCKYETNWGKISALFGLPTYYVPERYGENNLFGIGRGSFPRTFQKMKRGKLFAENSYELLDKKLSNHNKKKKYLGKNILTSVSKNYSEFAKSDQPQLLCRDSRKILIPKQTVHAVVTDPPYFDMINYSHLADFFYVWLRLGLKNEYSHFKNQSSTSKNEIVLRNFTVKEHEKYVKRLIQIFNECKRVLMNDGMMIFTFHHSKQWAWENLRNVLNKSGFVVTASHVIRSEGRTGYRNKRGSTGYDVVIIARKRNVYNAPKIKYSQIQDNCLRILKDFKQQKIELDPSDVFTTIMSKYIQSDDRTSKKIMENLDDLSGNLILKTKIKSTRS